MAASIDDILGQLQLPERVYHLCVRPDLQASWEQAEADLAAAERDSRDTLAGMSSAAKAAAKQVQDVEAEMASHMVPLRLRALSSKAWSDLVAKHPPREDLDERSWNADTFGVALFAAAAVEPVMSEDQAGSLVDRLTMGQWNDLQSVLFTLNATGGVEVPKSKRASDVLRSSKKK